MKVPLVDLKVQLETIEKDLKAAVNEVIDSTQYILGTRVEELEKRIAEYVDAEFAVGVSSGTDALLISLMALDVGPGDRIVTTPYSFFATVGCIARLGATPLFVDIDSDTYNMSAEALHECLERERKDGHQIKAIIPVHLYGQCADMDHILDIAHEHGIDVIEDAAQAIGSTYPSHGRTRRAGSMGRCGCFSFFPSKNLGGIGDGGMVVTHDQPLAEKMRVLRLHGAQPKNYHALVGGNFRLDPIQAAALLAKLPHLDHWHAMRRERAAYYDRNLKSCGIKTPALAYSPDCHIYHQYVISVPENRDDLAAFLSKHQIQTAVYYPVPLNEQECFQHLEYKKGKFPHAEHAAEHTLALPMYPELPQEMQDFVIGRIEAFYA